MAKFGIDVSKWQGKNFDFARAKREDNIEFVIIRGACALYKDPQFESFYTKCKSLHLPVGVYHYSMATTVEGARKEAEFFYNNVLRGKQFDLPIYIDVEDKVQLALPKRLLTDIVKAWCEYLENKRYFVGIYAGKYQFRDNLIDDELKKYTHWIPMWGKNCTYADKDVLGMWQFGGETNVIRSNKIAGVVTDQNYMYVNFPAIIRSSKLNGFGAVVQNTQQKAAFRVGDRIKLTDNAVYHNGKNVPRWVKKLPLYVRSADLGGGNYNVSILKVGAITGRVNKRYFKKA